MYTHVRPHHRSQLQALRGINHPQNQIPRRVNSKPSLEACLILYKLDHDLIVQLQRRQRLQLAPFGGDFRCQSAVSVSTGKHTVDVARNGSDC